MHAGSIGYRVINGSVDARRLPISIPEYTSPSVGADGDGSGGSSPSIVSGIREPAAAVGAGALLDVASSRRVHGWSRLVLDQEAQRARRIHPNIEDSLLSCMCPWAPQIFGS